MKNVSEACKMLGGIDPDAQLNGSDPNGRGSCGSPHVYSALMGFIIHEDASGRIHVARASRVPNPDQEFTGGTGREH